MLRLLGVVKSRLASTLRRSSNFSLFKDATSKKNFRLRRAEKVGGDTPPNPPGAASLRDARSAYMWCLSASFCFSCSATRTLGVFNHFRLKKRKRTAEGADFVTP